ncbi:MAG: hypothetical protein K1W02_06715 [Muribaculaceae bacterium]
MKRFFTSCMLALAALSPLSMSAQTNFGIANHLGVDVNVGTTGVGFEVSTPITQFIQARAGLSYMPGFSFNVSTDVTGSYTYEGQKYEYVDNIDAKGDLSRLQGSLIFNVYPFGKRSSFFVAAGGYFGGETLVKVKGHSAEAAKFGGGEIEIGDYKIPVDKDGNAKGGIKVDSFRPYFGIGTGRPCPKGRLNFMWELGVQIHGKPSIYTDYGEVLNLPEGYNDDDFQEIMDNVKIYPVLRFTISGRIF